MQIGKVEFEIDGGAMMRVTIQYINIPYTNNISTSLERNDF